jgi:hypothetical protein
MKCQFATIEAFASLLLSLAMVFTAGRAVNNYIGSSAAQRYASLAEMAVFDFQHQLYSNASMETCFSSPPESGNGSCMGHYAALYSSVYHIDMMIITGNSDAGDHGRMLLEQCIPYKAGSGITDICILAGD